MFRSYPAAIVESRSPSERNSTGHLSFSVQKWRTAASDEDPGFYLLSLQEAIASYKVFVSDARWRTGWFSVFADGGGDFYVVDFDCRHQSLNVWTQVRCSSSMAQVSL